MQCSFKYLIGRSERMVFSQSPRHLTTSLQSPPPPPGHYPMDSASYTDLLKSLTTTHSLTDGKAVHAHLLKALFTPCLFLQNNLLNMYCKCGGMTLARNLFDLMPSRNIVSWNLLITGYSQLGCFSRAIGVLNETRNAGIWLDRFTYATALSVCAQSRDLSTGKIIHGLVVVDGLSPRTFLTNSLIDMYSKCGKIDDARCVFDSSDELDDVSWNSLISAHVRIGLVKETLRIFARMHREGLRMNSFALGSILKSCSSSNDSKGFGKVVHGCVIKVGLDSDVFIGSAMLDMYSKTGSLDEAVKVFKLMPDPNVVVFNAMIAGFCRPDVDAPCEITTEALSLFAKMQRKGMNPSKFTFSSVLRACNLTEAFEFGKQIHGLVFKHNVQADEFIASAVIDLYSNAGDFEDGLKCFRSVPGDDIVTWTSMISGCVQNEQFERALRLFLKLLRAGLKPDQFTLSCVMSACANLALARSGEQIQGYVTKAGFGRFTICGNSQIFMYARSGDIDAAGKTFQEIKYRDVVSWSAMISSHAQHGCAKDALLLFKEMEEDRQATPNHVTFLGVLTACSHGGLVDEGFRYFKSMARDYGMKPNVKHCACIVDLLGRTGTLAEAEEFILESGFNDDPVMWRALLGSCRVHKDTARGKRVAERVMELEPAASASYVLLYNMYLDAGKRSLAMRTRELMNKRRVKKEPGLSWIEIGDSVHFFVVGDKSHPQSHAIYTKLDEMLLKVEGKDPTRAETLDYDDSIPGEKQGLVNCHSEKLAVALGMINLPQSAPIRVMKNLRVCVDCHTKMKLFSESEGREIILRDPIRFHRFRGGSCSCGDYW